MAFPKPSASAGSTLSSGSPSFGGGGGGASPSPGSPGLPKLGLSRHQNRMASLIIQTGLRMGFDWRDIKVALMTAYQESRLQNLNYGSGSSLGLFQQTDVWEGNDSDHMDAEWATRSFYRALRNVDGRSRMPLWEVAQSVQRSAYPTAYRQWHNEAANIIKHWRTAHGDNPGLGDPSYGATRPQHPTISKGMGVKVPFAAKKRGPLDAHTPRELGASDQPMDLPTFNGRRDFNDAMERAGMMPPGSTGNMTARGIRKRLIAIAKGQIGVPYVWGGESPGGFDCSGFTQWVYNQIGVNLPRVSYEQGQSGYGAFGGRRQLSNLMPGDLVLWNNSSRNNGADHVAIYLGNGKIIEAPRPGRSVGISSLYDTGNAWGVHLNL